MSKLIIYEYITYICLILLIIFIAVWNSIIDPSENIPRILPTIIYNIPLLVVMNKLKKNGLMAILFEMTLADRVELV